MYNNSLINDRITLKNFFHQNFKEKLTAIMYEKMPLKPIFNHDIYDNVAKNDFFCLLLENEMTPVVYKEFEAAKILGIPIYVFIKSGKKNNQLKKFINEHIKQHHFFYYNNIKELHQRLIVAKEIISDNLNQYQNRKYYLTDIYYEIVKALHKNPELVYDISPYRFEELLSNIFQAFGYKTITTPKSKDKGYDIVAKCTNKTDILFDNEYKYNIEAKLWNPKNKIGRPILQKLYGASHPYNSNGIIVLTTSFFTREAYKYANSTEFLKEYIRLYDKDYLPTFYKKYLDLKTNIKDLK